MDPKAVESYRHTLEQTVRDLVDDRGDLQYFKRYEPFRRPGDMPVNIVTHHMAGAFAGLLNQPEQTQHDAIRARVHELVDELIGTRNKRLFLLEERPAEFWQEGPHLHYTWRCGCAEAGEEQTEEQFVHGASQSR